MERKRVNRPLNEQPDLLDIAFPPTPEEEERLRADLKDRLSQFDPTEEEVWFDTLPEVPKEDVPGIDRMIHDAQDIIRIMHQRQRPSDN